MKNLKVLLVSILIVSIWGSCEIVDEPFPAVVGNSITSEGTEYIIESTFNIRNEGQLLNFINSQNNWLSKDAPNNSNQRFVVLEEFTGHTCTFCPNGTRELTRLDNKYKDTLIPIGIHAGNFATPRPSGDKFTTDFRVPNDDGATYLRIFKVQGYPSGIVSRINENASGSSSWEQDIISNKNKENVVSLSMTNYSDSSINAIRTNIEINWKTDLTENYNLQLFLVEDNIIDWQLDNGVEVEDYNHRHVLRKVVNSTFGRELESAERGKIVNYEYIFSYNPEWKYKDLEVVAFIFDSNPNSYDIIQANAAKLK